MSYIKKSLQSTPFSVVFFFIFSTFILFSLSSCRTDSSSADDSSTAGDSLLTDVDSGVWNPQDPVLIELVFPRALKNLDAVGQWATEYLDVAGYSDALELFYWDRHVLVNAVTLEPEVLLGALSEAFPEAQVRWHRTPFYRFDRSRECPDAVMSPTWDYHFFTASLVADTIAQRAYMEHHALQRDEWPEVSLGFCNAEFQQLLLFRSGRQLILLISIPAGADFEALNRKSTFNNHRMHEWNALMQEFQEGLPYAPAGNVWVKFKK